MYIVPHDGPVEILSHSVLCVTTSIICFLNYIKEIMSIEGMWAVTLKEPEDYHIA